MKYAIIQVGSKQYKVHQGEVLLVEKMEGNTGDELTFDKVLLVSGDGNLKIGQPTVPQAVVKGKLLKQEQSEKIRVATYKAKSRYRRVKGHRHQLTRVEIAAISEKRGPKKKGK